MNINYELNHRDHTAIITKSPNASGDIFIPKYIRHNLIRYKIISIEKAAFQSNESIRSVTFAEDSEIKTIKIASFCSSSITSIIIPKSVIEIEDYSFHFCNSLKSIECVNGSQLYKIGNNAFNSYSLERLKIPESAYFSYENALENAKSLISIELIPGPTQYLKYDNNQKVLYENYLYHSQSSDFLLFACRDIERIKIPSNIKGILSFAFSHCKKLKTIEFETNSQIDYIGYCSFLKCYSITEISIPSNIKEIYFDAFQNCKNLRKIHFDTDSQLISLGKGAFTGTNVKSMIIPSKVNHFTQNCFVGYNFEKLEILGNEPFFDDGCFPYCNNLKVISMPNAKQFIYNSSAFNGSPQNLVIYICSNSKVEIYKY